MPLALRVALLAATNRDGVGRIVVAATASVVALPLFALVAGVGVILAASGVMPAAAMSGAVPPMAAWVVTQPFGCSGFRLEPARGSCDHFHQGIDLAAAASTPIRSVLPGVARVYGPAGVGCGGLGNHVAVQHAGGEETIYAHLDSSAVADGQRVAAGQVVGYEGSTGCSTGPHLHFEVRRGGVAVDPREAFPGMFSSTRTSSADSQAPRLWRRL